MSRTRHFTACGLLAIAVMMAGCSVDNPKAPTATTNQMEFPVRIGAIGNSLTAGFINGGLIEGGQHASFPNLISLQAGSDSLEMPLVASPGVGAPNSLGIPQGALYVDATGAITSDDVLDPKALLKNSRHPVPYDNLGVPGATTSDVIHATDAVSSVSGANSFFNLILRNFDGETGLTPGDATEFDQMKALRPHVLTLWIGSNDILGAAMGGDPGPANYTPPSFFEASFVEVLDSVATTGAKAIAVANIPSVTSAPFFTTIPVGTDPGGGFVRWQMDDDTDGDPDSVQFVLLTAAVANSDSAVLYLPGGSRSLPDASTLTSAEIDLVETTIQSYNTTIGAEVASRGWALVDVAAALEALPADPGNPANFGQLNAIFAWLPDPSSGAKFQNINSAFSLDGIHPSEKGQAYVANLFIDAINAKYSMAVPRVDEASVSNLVGFEQAPSASAARKGAAAPLFDEAGLEALRGLPKL